MKLRYFLVVVEDIDLKIKRQKSCLLFFFKKNGLLFNTNLSCVFTIFGKTFSWNDFDDNSSDFPVNCAFVAFFHLFLKYTQI